MVAVSLVGAAVVGVVKRRALAAVVVTLTAGGLVAGIAAAPLDCSVRLDYCEKLVAAGFASDAHLVHVALSGALTVVAAIAAVLAARRRRSAGAVALALVVVAAATAMFAVPTSDYLGTFQAVTLAGGAWATVRLWLSPPTLVSPP